MKYKDAITDEMNWLAHQPNTIFLGQGLVNAGRIYGTLDRVPLHKCVEMPIAENLIAGAALGLALSGKLPIVVFQRMDFMLIAADAILNHAALLARMSGGNVRPHMIFRTIIGSGSPKFDVGLQHKQDYSDLFTGRIRVQKYGTLGDYHMPATSRDVWLVIERKDDYEQDLAA